MILSDADKKVETDSGTVWVASYPKSGNTWMYDLFNTLACTRGYDLGAINVYELFFNHQKVNPFPFVRGAKGRNFFLLKTHAAYDQLEDHAILHPDLLKSLRLVASTAGFIYILRHPLDVVLSYINYTRLEYSEEKRREDDTYRQQLFNDFLGISASPSPAEWYQKTLETIDKGQLNHALDYFTQHNGIIPTLNAMSGSWFENVESWTAAATDDYHLILRYEDLVADYHNFKPLTRLFDFNEAEIIDALNRIKTLNASYQAANSMTDDKVFYNKMRAGYYADFFDAQLVKRFYERHGERLSKLGYNPDGGKG